MTEKEMNKLAELVSSKVVDKIERKQQQWDIEFHADMQHFVSDSTAKVEIVDEKQSLEAELDELSSLVSEYIHTQQFEKIGPVKERMTELYSMIDKLK